MIRLKQLITESIPINGVEISTVPINWSDPKEGKYSGRLRAKYNGSTVYYKMSVNPLLLKPFNVLLKAFWKNTDGSYGIKTSKDQLYPITKEDMEEIINNIKKQVRTFTLSSIEADLTLTKV